MVCLTIVSVVVGALSYLHLNVGWSVGVLGIAMFSIRRRNTGIKDDYLAHVTRKRLEALQNPETSGESAEWINAILKTIWPILNPDLLSSLLSLLEDTMKRHSPAIIRGVKIQDLVLGTNSLQVLSFKVLANDVDIGGVKVEADEGDFIVSNPGSPFSTLYRFCKVSGSRICIPKITTSTFEDHQHAFHGLFQSWPEGCFRRGTGRRGSPGCERTLATAYPAHK